MAEVVDALLSGDGCFDYWNGRILAVVQLLLYIYDRLIRAGQVRFVDDDYIGNFEDSGFLPLQLVAGLRLDDEYDRVGYPPDCRVGLASADGFNKDTIKPV